MAKLNRQISQGAPFKIAVIGGGAGARELVIDLMDSLKGRPISIDIFESRHPFGRGIAWSDEASPVLANMRVNKLGPNYPEYDAVDVILKEIGHSEAGQEYPTRKAVGAAFDERWRHKSAGWINEVALKIVPATVTDIDWDGQAATVILSTGPSHNGYDRVVLATGNIPQKTILGFENNSRFLNGWDVISIEAIDPRSDVFVIGAGLTAIDATIRLLQNGQRHPGNASIVWQSRNTMLPFVRPRQLNDLKLSYITRENFAHEIERLAISGKQLTLARIWELFRLELETQANREPTRFDSETTYSRFLALCSLLENTPGDINILENGIAGAHVVSLWFSVAKHFDEYLIPFLWNALPESEKVAIRQYGRRFDCLWAPIPLPNGLRLKQWLEDGTVQLLQGVLSDSDYVVDRSSGKLRFSPLLSDPRAAGRSPAELAKRYHGGFDYVIDAMGIKSDLKKLDSALVHNLVAKKILVPNLIGRECMGAKVDWHSGAVFDVNSRPHDWLYALAGSLTIGAHKFTNSFLAVSLSAMRTAAAIAEDL